MLQIICIFMLLIIIFFDIIVLLLLTMCSNFVNAIIS